MESGEFRECQLRRKKIAAAPEKRKANFARKYQTWRNAVPDACKGMHSLNRYAKHQGISTANKTEIYQLKNELVELLWRAGYCVECWIHVLTLPAKPCWDCGGSGDGGECERCNGTGEYLSAKKLRFYCFRFNVSGRIYTWHQPDKLVKWQVQTTGEPANWEGVERDKPLAMPKSQFAEAKDVIRWVLSKSGGEGLAGEPVYLERGEVVVMGDEKQEVLF